MTTYLLDLLSEGPLLADGALGTALHEQGIPYAECFEALSVTQPALVQRVHQRYLDAGARLLQTNTFGANRFRLAAHGLEGEVAALNRAAVQLARSLSPSALVAGSVGPTGLDLGRSDAGELAAVRAAFEQQVRALDDAGADALVLETMRHPRELLLALEAARQNSNKPVIALASFDPGGAMADGTGPERLADALAKGGASVLGANCCDGPDAVLAAVVRMRSAGLPLAARPSAGLPREGRYGVGPEALARYVPELLAAGVRLLGGCCGTTAAHTRALRSALGQLGHLQ